MSLTNLDLKKIADTLEPRFSKLLELSHSKLKTELKTELKSELTTELMEEIRVQSKKDHEETRRYLTERMERDYASRYELQQVNSDLDDLKERVSDLEDKAEVRSKAKSK